MPEPEIKRWADLLPDYSIAVKRSDAVAIFSTILAEDLVLALHNGILARDGELLA